MSFRVLQRSSRSGARTGRLATVHGVIRTPAFMPIATKAAVKNIEAHELRGCGADVLLSNTYHLWLRPGTAVIKRHGGLHTFMQWDGPILTDSGGYQVFSLTKHRNISERGVRFRDPVDGKEHFLSPEESMRIQRDLRSDIAMVLDECPPYPSSKQYALHSMERTTRWAKRCFASPKARGQLRFGIVQGSTFLDLRTQHAKAISALPFDGFAIGGVSVGEPARLIQKIIAHTAPLLPATKPRYVMGMGMPHQIVEAVRFGIDMFDCVLPTRDGRHGRLYVWTSTGRKRIGRTKNFWSFFNARSAAVANSARPVDPQCHCPLCGTYSRAYLRHLFATNEPLAMRLATMHNLTFYLELMERIRSEIRAGKL